MNLIAEERLSLQELRLLWDVLGPALFWRSFFSDTARENRQKMLLRLEVEPVRK